MNYKTIIGLEIHVELKTETKIFCGCKNAFGSEANTHVCPVCLGLPGAMPKLNRKAIDYALMAGLAFHCDISSYNQMDRKSYFYPDLTKGYQISQDQYPICQNGHITIDTEDGTKDVRLIRIHLEEDTGKAIHTETEALMDYNRAGVPLIEIVSAPDMETGEEARAFLEELRSTLTYLGISDCKLEEGSMRCDVNINVKDLDTGHRTVITEVKNINSFRGVVKTIEFETARHQDMLQRGETGTKVTRRWDDVAGETVLMREKLVEPDYRFAAEADLPPFAIDQEWIDRVRDTLPELPREKRNRFMENFGLSAYDAGVLTGSQDLADFYEAVASHHQDYEQVSNWMMGEVLRRVNDEGLEFTDLRFTPQDLADLLALIDEGKISQNVGKKVFRSMFEQGDKPADIVKREGLVQISDEGALEKMVEEVLDANPQSIEDFKNGKSRALGFLVGQVMKHSKGKANPQMVNAMIAEKLKERK